MSKSSIPNWEFDEALGVGVDYSNSDIVKDYDKYHTKFRDFQAEASGIVSKLELTSDDVLLDFGCGSGGLTTHFAQYCKKVYAVDISKAMIDLCNRKIEEGNLKNIETIRKGFLTYDHVAEKPDAIVSIYALHHLPDFWKLIALRRMNAMLKPGGKLFLSDVVFSFSVDQYKPSVNNWLEEMQQIAGKEMMEESVVHIKEEFSTWDWIMEKMLDLAGFKIDTQTSDIPNIISYTCSQKNS